MLTIRQKQLEAFRPAMRAKRAARLLEASASDAAAQAERDSTTGDILAKDARGNVTRLSFSPDGLPSRVTRPSGAQLQFDHDDKGQLAVVTYPGGERIEVERDALGNVRELKRPGISSHRLEYDGDRLAAAQYPDGTRTLLSYDETGRLAAVTDRAGATTQFDVAAGGRLRATTDPLGRQTVYRTDEAGGLVAIEFPDGTREGFAYDSEQRVATLMRRDGSEVEQRLDAQGALRAVAWPDGSVSTFDFDGEGNLVTAQNGVEAVRSTFDAAGNPLTEETSAGVVQYAYDPDGRLIGLTTPWGERISYAYDGDGRLHVVRDWYGREYALTYAAGGTVAAIRYGNGVTETQSYARVGRLSRATVSGRRGESLGEQSYEYDLLERLTQASDSDGGFSLAFAYDAESRVVRETDAAGRSVTYAYDAKGNLVGVDEVAVEIGPMDEPFSSGGAAIEYDALGNMTRFRGPRGETTCRFSADGMLAEAQVGGRVVRFAYDALCRRVAKTDGAATWRYGWAGHQLLWEEFRERPDAEPVRRDYLFVPDSATPIAFREAERTFWLQSDARGAIIRAFDDVGKVVWRATYDSFGQARILVNQVRQPFRILGHYADEETGLHYNFARYYGPHLRSYLSRDPNWHDPAATNYSYARNDPWNRADPFGAIAPLLLVVGAVALGAVVGGAIGAAVAYATGGDPVAGAVDGAMAGAGAVLGGILGGPVGLIVGGMIGGALGAFTGSLIEQFRRGDELSVPCALKAAGISLAMDVALLGLGRIPGVKRLVKAVGEKLVTLRKPLMDWARTAVQKVKPYLDPRNYEVRVEGLGSTGGNIRITRKKPAPEPEGGPKPGDESASTPDATTPVDKPPSTSEATPTPAAAGSPPRKPGEGVNVDAKWGNPKSQKAYGHSLKEHGSKRPEKELKDRARGTGTDQGQFMDDQAIVEAEQLAPLTPGAHVVDLGRPVGKVHKPDGTTVDGVTKVVVVRKPDGTVRTSYPVDE